MKLIFNNSSISFRKSQYFKVGEWEITFPQTANNNFIRLFSGDYTLTVTSEQSGFFILADSNGNDIIRIEDTQFGVPKRFTISSDTGTKIALGNVGTYNIVLHFNKALEKVAELTFVSKYTGSDILMTAAQPLPAQVSSESHIYYEWITPASKFDIPFFVGVMGDGSWVSRYGQNSALVDAGSGLSGIGQVFMQSSVAVTGANTDGDATFKLAFYKEKS